MQVENKRKKVFLSPEEKAVIKGLLLRALFPILLIVVTSSILLFFGFKSLMSRTAFANYSINPSLAMQSASRFIVTYITIATLNIVLMIALSIVVLFMELRNVVLPIVRITHIVRRRMDTHSKAVICVREGDQLLVPLVDQINVLLHETQADGTIEKTEGTPT